ncbi:adenine deaminase [Catalinimonas alkaloidigena]|uniref:Adenine deaminase n=1 Tax=Catalinimonas alkaloidigena TaxID=1075417 RepID=A0A1G9GNK9_9BACT|nr:adenine deaminase [Catalinimonas alkaloidigena]SDL02279.1 adenine deaminase [Catalinimonas alkaloidigena]
MAASFTLFTHLIDLHQRRTYPAEITVQDGRIRRIAPTDQPVTHYALPGFVDAHVHIESSMLTPSEFARLAVVHGTVATVSDPHEIGNVLGVPGLEFMIEDGNKVPFKFSFGASPCVPATPFETAGATLTVDDVAHLLAREEVRYLSEMMNWPGVLQRDADVMAKINLAHQHGKPVDGHAPGLRGEQARQYAAAGISTDHECFTADEARDKLACGMHILIREGSAARNFDALIDLMGEAPERLMFCSDDKHPDALVEGHIDQLVKRALAKGFDLYDVLRAACVNPVVHYRMPVGLLREGDPADFILVDDPTTFRVLKTWIDGELVAEQGLTALASQPCEPLNSFEAHPKQPTAFRVANEGPTLRVIEALDGQLITNVLELPHRQTGAWIEASVPDDLLKIAVVNRYQPDAPPAVGFIKGFGLTQGALASSVAHDSHNIVAVGADDASLCRAVNAVIREKGGIAVVHQEAVAVLSLPVAGLMSTENGYEVARQYATLDRQAKELGSRLGAPFMTLSFMALLVIPRLKMSDRGLFDGEAFTFVKPVE